MKTLAEMIKDAAKIMMESVMPIINEKLAFRDAVIIEKLKILSLKFPRQRTNLNQNLVRRRHVTTVASPVI